MAWPLLGAPLAEELVFRAGLQAWLMRRMPALPAIALSSVLFAAGHLGAAPLAHALWTLLPSLALGALYAHTGRLGPCVLLHAACNAVWLAARHFQLPLASWTSP